MVIVAYGRVGQGIAAALKRQGIAFVVADEDRDLVEELRQAGQAAVRGNAVEPATLIQAHWPKRACGSSPPRRPLACARWSRLRSR